MLGKENGRCKIFSTVSLEKRDAYFGLRSILLFSLNYSIYIPRTFMIKIRKIRRKIVDAILFQVIIVSSSTICFCSSNKLRTYILNSTLCLLLICYLCLGCVMCVTCMRHHALMIYLIFFNRNQCCTQLGIYIYSYYWYLLV